MLTDETAKSMPRDGSTTKRSMNFNDSRLVSLLKLFRRSGLRFGMNTVATTFARKYFRVPPRVFPDLEGVLHEERPACLSVRRSGPLEINWLLPSIAAAHGGLLNVFRTIQQLEAWGHENRVYVQGRLPGGSAAAKEHIRKSYFHINAEVEALSDNIKDSDALIATSWPTAYAARSIGNTAQKFYFVQDIEYMFYAPGGLYEFARQTYRFGFRGITLGPWIADVLRREFNMECSAFGFSYDRGAYAFTGSRLLPPGKKRVLFYARPETERRGFELGVLALSLVAKKMPEVEFALVGTRQMLDLPFPAIFSGVLPISELGALYRSCDVALVLSHTNLSMLPLELMACGCAVVSNEGPNVEWLLTDQTVQLAKPDPKSLAEAVIELLETDRLRLRKSDAGLAFARSTDWTKEIRTIESALLANREYSHQVAPYV
jgi:glycosyltransferase involved in cell wall biosynthesis